MFKKPIINVTYNSRLQRVRLQFRAAECMKSRKPPSQVLKRIEERLCLEKAEGRIEAYAVFDKRLLLLWQHLRRELGKSITEDQLIKFTAGQGARQFDEIQIKRILTRGKPSFLLDCEFTARKVITVSFNSFVFNIVQKLHSLEADFKVDRAQLRLIYLLLQCGRRIESMELIAAPKIHDSPSKGFIVRVNDRYGFASLHIAHPDCLTQSRSLNKLWDLVVDQIDHLNQSKISFHLLKSHSLEKLASLCSKVQAVGFNLPYDLLVGYDYSHGANAEMLAFDQIRSYQGIYSKEDLEATEPGIEKSPLQIEISSDGLHAFIKSCDQKQLDRMAPDLDIAGLIQWLKQAKVTFGYEGFASKLLQAIRSRMRLEGMTVAKGQAPLPGEEPYIHLIAHQAHSNQQTNQNLRDSQNKRMVLKGSRIAEIRYLDGIVGHDVCSREVHALGSLEAAGFKAGNGVRVEGDQYFYALRNGLVDLCESSLSLIETYTHVGTINLASGNLYFDGPTVIQGDIEAGATVVVKGPLIVEGMIGPATIRCDGNLEVKGGIMTGPNGCVAVKGGSIRCEFIANSVVQLSGDLYVQRSILHSQLTCGGRIRIIDEGDGIIAGGRVSSTGSIKTAAYGLKQTRQSECRVGVDYELELQLVDHKLQLFKSQENLAKLQRQLKQSAQIDKRLNPNDRHDLVSKITKCTAVVEQQLAIIAKLEAAMKWSPDASLIVSRRLDHQVKVVVAGRTIKVPSDLEAVIILAKPHEDSHFVPIKSGAILKQTRPTLDLAS